MSIALIAVCVWAIGAIYTLYKIASDASKNDPSGGLIFVVLLPVVLIFAALWPLTLPWMWYNSWKDKDKN